MPLDHDIHHKNRSADDPYIFQKFVSTPAELETADALANMISCNILMT